MSSPDPPIMTLNQGMALLCLVASNVLVWFAFVLMETPERFYVSNRQKIGLIFFFLLALVVFAKLYFTLRMND